MRERWWVADPHRDDDAFLARLRVCDWMQPSKEGSRLSTDRQSAALRHEGSPPLLVKWRRPIAGRRGRTILRASRERREALAALHALERGIETPAPMAAGELRQRGVLLGSVYLRAFDPDAQDGATAAADDPTVLATLAGALAEWHERGFRHGDCYPKNFLVGPAGVPPRPIGFPMAAFVAPGARLDRARRKDLAQFAAGCLDLGADVDPFGFLGPYAAHAPGAGHADRLRGQIREAYERVMARKAARLASRPIREPEGPPAPRPLPAGTGAGVVVRVRQLR